MDNATPKTTDAPTANALTAAVSLLVYGYFFLTFMAWFGFLLPSDHLPSVIANILPYSIDTAETNPNSAQAFLFDLFLLTSFAVPHSFLARSWVKEMMGLPKSLERSLFVLQTTIFMHVYMYCWQDFEPDFAFWKLSPGSTSSSFVLAFYLVGVLFVLSSSFALDHFHLFGLSQGFGMDFNKMLGLTASDAGGELVVRWHYSLVAHPIMTGILINLWATPVMTAPRLLFAIVNTLYIVLAVRLLEEPQLEKIMGPKYREYRLSVPRFIPGMNPPCLNRHGRLWRTSPRSLRLATVISTLNRMTAWLSNICVKTLMCTVSHSRPRFFRIGPARESVVQEDVSKVSNTA